MKKAILYALCVLLCLSLAACAKTPDAEQTTAPADTSVTDGGETAAPTESATADTTAAPDAQTTETTDEATSESAPATEAPPTTEEGPVPLAVLLQDPAYNDLLQKTDEYEMTLSAKDEKTAVLQMHFLQSLSAAEIASMQQAWANGEEASTRETFRTSLLPALRARTGIADLVMEVLVLDRAGNRICSTTVS